MARHGSGRRNGLSGRTKKLDSELWQQDLDQQNGTRGSFRFPPDRRHQKRSTDVLRKPDNCKSYRHHFRQYAPEKLSYAMDRFMNEMNRIYGVMNGRLKDN